VGIGARFAIIPSAGSPIRLSARFCLGAFGLFFACLCCSSTARSAVQLRDNLDEYSLSTQAQYLADPEAKLDATAALADTRWQPLGDQSPVFGFVDGAYWFRTRIEHAGHAEQRWVYLLTYALLDHVELHIVRADGTRETRRSGDRMEFASRDLKHRHFNFLIDIAAGESVELLLRVQTESSMQAPQWLITRSAFFARTHEAQAGMGVYYGVLLALLLFNLIIFVSLREAAYGWYVLYVLSFGMVQLNLNGLAFEYLWPTSPNWANLALPLTMAFAMTMMTQFASSFLDLRRRRPGLWRIFTAMCAFQLLMLIAIPLIGYRPAILIETACVFVIALLILVAAIRLVFDGYKAARYFLLAWTAVLLGAVSYALVSFGALPKLFITEYGIQIGSALEMTLLSFALAFRIRDLESEKQRLVQANRDELETQVAQRTRDLNEALSKLSALNARLHEYSLRDGLTGAYNRRFLEQSLQAIADNCAETGTPLAVLMIDIDHFKRINDEHGHLVGDDCLRAVADLLQSHVGGKDERLARWGGEEFAAILPGATLQQAEARAECIRSDLAGRASLIRSPTIRLQLSIGVACATPESSEPVETLIEAADRALYQAKRSGRNRVVLA